MVFACSLHSTRHNSLTVLTFSLLCLIRLTNQDAKKMKEAAASAAGGKKGKKK